MAIGFPPFGGEQDIMSTGTNTRVIGGWLIVLIGVLGAPAALGQVVEKVADGFETVRWRVAEGGAFVSAAEASPAPNSSRSISIEGEPSRSMAIVPKDPLVVPGQARSLSMWIKRDDARRTVRVVFKDGWGREAVAGKPLAWVIAPVENASQWTRVQFDVPADWVSPIQITRLVVDSDSKSDKPRSAIQIDDLAVATDITNVDRTTGLLTTWTPDPSPADPKTALKSPPATRLVDLVLSTPEQGNVFAGPPASATAHVHNWLPRPLKSTLNYSVADADQTVVHTNAQSIEIDGVSSIDLALPGDRFGLYSIDARLPHAEGANATARMTYALLPEPRELTEAEKMASPYGLNHYGNVGMMIKPFRKAGIIWIRDYGFIRQRLLEARAQDGSFSRWPFFGQVLKEFEEADLKVMPVLQQTIIKPKLEDGKPVGPLGPDEEWVKLIGSLIRAFPQVTHWEASNEYDILVENHKAEEAVNWENYGKYHAKLAELVRAVHGDKGVTIENGRAGIFPELERDMVMSGHVDPLDVINSHYYTGTEPPEVSTLNYNTHTDSFLYQEKGLYYDQLRAATRAGQADGKKRQHWLTEFGWDTLAGPVVSPYEQAVFLQRGWLLALAAGCEKSFWFYNFDSKEPRGFFDGCGLFTFDGQPKLALSAMAGMAWALPSPRYVGMISVGDNTGGYVLEQSGKMVAVLFSIRGDGPEVEIEAEHLYDYLANPIASKRVKLSMAPTYAVGLNTSSALYKQTAYSLDTPYLIAATPGDPIKPVVKVENNRTTPIDATIAPRLPAGWKTETPQVRVTVSPGESKLVEFPITVGPGEDRGTQIVTFAIAEASGEAVKQIPLQVGLQPAIQMRLASITGAPGEVQLDVELGNNATTPREGVLRLSLPAAWKADVREIAVSAISPGEARTVPIRFTWSPDVGASESAQVVFEAQDKATFSRPLIPPQHRMPAAPAIALDGDLADWPADAQVPGWMLGSTTGDHDAKLYAAWSPEGLYFAVDVSDSKVLHNDPKGFWTGDVLEVFVDAANNKQPRPFGVGEHQFWFVPLPDKQAVYAGQWKVANEIPQTQYDIQQVKGASRRTGDGYVMELFIPAELLRNYDVGRGEIGINLNLTVVGQQRSREIYWPRQKSAGVQRQQQHWGSVKLMEKDGK